MSQQNNSVYVRKITLTAIFLALLIAFQFLTASIGQYVTGSFVNLILITATILVGLYSGIVIALISPVIAVMLGIGASVVQILPFIMLGNLVLVLTWHFTFKYLKIESLYVSHAVSAVSAAILKFLVFYFGLIKIALPLFLSGGIINSKQAAALSVTFSFPQLITALIGGAVAVILLPVLKKAVK